MDHSTATYKKIGVGGAILSGPLLFIAHVLGDAGDSPNGTVAGSTLVFMAHLLSIFAFAGLYPIQHLRTGWIRTLGMLLSIMGTVTVCAVVFVEIAGASGADVANVLNSSPVSSIAAIGPLLFVIGIILFSLSEITTGAISRVGGGLLLAGTVIFAGGTIISNLDNILSIIGAGITGAGLFWLGAARYRYLWKYK